jgi:hypothetical protein
MGRMNTCSFVTYGATIQMLSGIHIVFAQQVTLWKHRLLANTRAIETRGGIMWINRDLSVRYVSHLAGTELLVAYSRLRSLLNIK